MLKEQRHKMILDYLSEHQFAKVETLSQLSQSTLITTRRDINELALAHKLEKVHGGAQHLQVQMHDISVTQRMDNYRIEKDCIAQVAASYIKHGATVYLDAGTSTHLLIPYLKDKDVKVITHGIHHVEALAILGIDTYLIGGHVKTETLATVGSTTTAAIEKLHFDIAFLGTNAVDGTFGFSTPDSEEALIKTKIIEQSSQAYILADASKFNKKSHTQFAGVDVPVITNFKSNTDTPYTIIKA